MLIHGGLYALLVLICTFDNSLYQIYVNIFFIGLLFVPRSACMFTYIMEIAPDNTHEDMTLFVYIGDGLTFVISGFFTMYTRDVHLFLIILSSIVLVSILFLYVCLDESPRFLYSKRRYEELKVCLKHIQKSNGV
jgi:MFS family permease